MKKVILIGLVLILVVMPVFAKEIAYYFKVGDTPTIKRECFNQGSICDSTFECNLTVYHPNGSFLITDQVMNMAPDHYNYTLNGPLNDVGEYRTRMSCSNGVYAGSEVFYFKVNPTGDDRENTMFLVLAIGSLIMLVLAFMFKSDILGFVAGVMFFVTGVYVMVYGITGLFDMYTRAIAFVSIGLGLLFTIVTAYNLGGDFVISKGGNEDG